MRILFLIRSLEVGGAERQLVGLANGLKERGHTVAVVVFYGGGQIENDLKGVELFDLGKRGRWDIPNFLLRLRRCVIAFEPDIMHGYLGTANLLTLLMKPFCKARSVWGIRSSYVDYSAYGLLSRLHFKIECLVSGLADHIISNSYAGREYAIENGVVNKNFSVIPNGIDTELFSPFPEGGEALRAFLGIPTGYGSPLVVGSVGRIDHMKDIPTLLRAVAKVLEAGKSLTLIHFGEGDSGPFQKMAGELGIANNVVFAGRQSDMRAAYASLDFLCLSSIGEGFPNVVGEAMACGVPCVVTDVGDSEAIVGELGVVVNKKGDATTLALGMSNMIGRLGQGDIPDTRSRIIKLFSLEQMVIATERVLSGVAK